MVGLKIVDEILNKSFYKLGLLVGRHPGYFLIVPVLLTLLGITGFQRIHTNIDPEYLFSPINGEGKIERSIVESFFKVNYTSKFNVARITRAGNKDDPWEAAPWPTDPVPLRLSGRFGRVIVTSKDGNKNLLRTVVWKELRLLDGIIQNMTVYHDDDYFTYKDICARWMSDCFQNDILNLDYIMDDVSGHSRFSHSSRNQGQAKCMALSREVTGCSPISPTSECWTRSSGS
ncbi:hypothetical protein Zmor_025039 [Zophobas morio]|uniref:Patched domain-containing protein 3 n=1 Tax=Zophobas morio TaxID=2755281 RepID=A0AA38HSN1_9CUCU|nr:hypothetical protein Zmor_025039 [Zophobas morio]